MFEEKDDAPTPEVSKQALDTLVKMVVERTFDGDLKEAPWREPVVELVDQLLLRAIKERATDLHIEPEELSVRIRYRIDAVLQPGPMLPKGLQQAITTRLKIMARLDINENRVPQTGRIRFDSKGQVVLFSVSTMLGHFGENVTVRVLDLVSRPHPIEELGLFGSDQGTLERMIARPTGVILVTGPGGSGKTTLVYALLQKLNTVDVSVMTIEDLVEYEFPLMRQTEVNRHAGMTYASALQTALRMDADVLFVGEMSDQETARGVMHAAATGHLVLSTMTASSAAQAIGHLCDGLRVERLQTIDHLIGVVNLRLARAVCQKCHKNVPVTGERRVGFANAADRLGLAWDETVAEANGCPDCRFRGTHGRVPIVEILEMTKEIEEAVIAGYGDLAMQTKAEKTGMRTLRDSALRLVLEHKITREEFVRLFPSERK